MNTHRTNQPTDEEVEGTAQARRYITQEAQSEAALQVILTVADAIRDLSSVPSGHLYARLMGHMSLQTYDGIVAALKGAKLVEERNRLLTWVGPAKDVA